jgi:hypothetical protein
MQAQRLIGAENLHGSLYGGRRDHDPQLVRGTPQIPCDPRSEIVVAPHR